MMPEMILYLLKVNIALLLFYAGYHFILQRYTFHTLNRFYLLAGLIYSALYPLIDLSYILNRNQHLKEQISIIAPEWQGSVTYAINTAENDSGNYWQIVLLIFWTGVIFMSLRLLIQLISLLTLHIQSSSFTIENFKFRKITKAVNPFSFWRTIYLNPECHEPSELKSILEHEQVHVKQLHTLDVLLAELSTIFYWFNPGVWLMKKAIKANLEYITDQEVIRSGVDSKEYQYALLKTQVLSQNSMPVNNFHFLTIKKRIAMINKKPSNKLNLSNYLLIVPAIMLTILIAGSSQGALNKEDLVKAITHFEKVAGQNMSAASGTDQSASVIGKVTTPQAVKPVISAPEARPDTNKLEVIQYKAPDNRSDINALIRNMNTRKNGKTDPAEPIYFVDGVRMANGISRLKPDSIATINVYKVQGTATINHLEVQNDVISIKTKSFKRSGATQTGKIITPGSDTSKKTSPIGIATRQNNAPDIVLRSINKTDTIAGSQPLYIIDGVRSKAKIPHLEPSSIVSINVRKGEHATSLYGIEAQNGVIEITTKSNIALRSSGGTAPLTVRGYYDPGSTQKISLGDIDKELIFLDGKEITESELDQIKVSSIGTIDIYKGSSAEAKYGERGKNGVVVITTKKN